MNETRMGDEEFIGCVEALDSAMRWAVFDAKYDQAFGDKCRAVLARLAASRSEGQQDRTLAERAWRDGYSLGYSRGGRDAEEFGKGDLCDDEDIPEVPEQFRANAIQEAPRHE